MLVTGVVLLITLNSLAALLLMTTEEELALVHSAANTGARAGRIALIAVSRATTNCEVDAGLMSVVGNTSILEHLNHKFTSMGRLPA